MLRHNAVLILLAALAGHVHAADPLPAGAACEASCRTQRQSCRAEADTATVNDTSPAMSMTQHENANASAVIEVRPRSEQLPPTDAQAFRARREERLRSCEPTYRNCSQACQAGPFAVPRRPGR